MPIIPISLDTTLEQREVDLLRLLARVRLCHGHTIQELICPTVNPSTRTRMLRRMVKAGLIWETTIPSPHRDPKGRPVGKAPTVYGLTERGYKRIKPMEISGGPFPYEMMAYRAANAAKAVEASAVSIDLYYADWIGSLLEQARRHPSFVGANIQREYVIRSTDGSILQTIGALIELVFDRSSAASPTTGPMIAWSPIRSHAPRQVIVRYGLDIDHAGRSDRWFFDHAVMYRRIAAANGYHTLFGSPVARPLVTQLAAHAGVDSSVTPAIIPVIIAAYDERNARLNELITCWLGAWDTWHDGWALFSHFVKTVHPEHGVMWGDYLAVNQRPQTGKTIGRTPLLASLFGPLDQWAVATAAWVPPVASDIDTLQMKIQSNAAVPLNVG
ncbi:hypothetical protein K2Z83_19845 [Oscillochloris sp. ZM17-4]|uniref:hypothetical protein n=1 Tax=Oscillochloris sp. ZM17-4 TaxID=2866714 RepID=UPI001C73D683|nr:hypothetical protein [Oscillochloris sp. ZM17-4]MBX0329922.1 hypothetical protein [Oscillochloris sp. ZM17-4]